MGEHLLCARLRTADQDAAAGSMQEVERIVGQIRSQWADARIVVRADSGFCREELMAWCEKHDVGYVLGFARNDRLRRLIAPQMEEAARLQQATGKPARVFTEFEYRTTTGSWGKARRVVAKAEQIEGKENPRFVVTNLSAEQWPAQRLYEELYCARGEMENRIKEQLSLFAARVSAESMKANQIRVNLAACAYVLIHALRRLGLKGGDGKGAGDNDPAAAAQDRRTNPDHGAQDLAVDGLWVSAARAVPTGMGATALLSRDGLSGQAETKRDSERSQAELWPKTPPAARRARLWRLSGPAKPQS